MEATVVYRSALHKGRDRQVRSAVVDSPDLQQASSMSLKDMQQAVQAYAPDLLSDKVLAQIQQDFDTLPPKQ